MIPMRAVTTVFVMLLVMGCDASRDAPETLGTGGATSGTTVGPGAGPTGPGSGGGSPVACDAAVEPFGAEVGQSFPDITLTDCAGGKHTLDELRCQNTITLVSVGAGWCEPCQEEAPELQAASVALADQGVGIVQVLFQDASGLPATTMFCDAWTQTFSLTIPTLIDPVGNTLEFFDQAQTPLNFVVDRDGVVLWAQTGKVDDVEGLLVSLLP